MFTRNILLILFCCALYIGQSQSKKFIRAMKKNMTMLDSAKTDKELLSAARTFRQMKQQDQWQVNYHTALGYLLACFEEKQEDQDALCDTAEIYIDRADSLSKENSEVYVLRSILASARIMSDPMGRWMQYGKRSYDALQKAMKLDDKNPRPHVFKGLTAMYTPGGAGGSCEKAMACKEKAEKCFAEFKAPSQIHPAWGRKQLKDIEKECDKK